MQQQEQGSLRYWNKEFIYKFRRHCTSSDLEEMRRKSKVALSLISAVGFSKLSCIISSTFLAVPSILRTFIRGEIGFHQLPFMCKLKWSFVLLFPFIILMSCIILVDLLLVNPPSIIRINSILWWQKKKINKSKVAKQQCRMVNIPLNHKTKSRQQNSGESDHRRRRVKCQKKG